MNDKPKRKNDHNPRRKVDWSFDFANLGDTIRNTFDNLREEAQVNHSVFSTPVDGATALQLHVAYEIGEIELRATANPEHLVHVDAHHTGELVFEASDDAERVVSITPAKAERFTSPIKAGINKLKDGDDLEWHIGVSPHVPVALFVKGGAGELELDMRRLEVHHVDVRGGVGETKLMLSDDIAELNVSVKGGVGEVKVYVPQNSNVNLDIKTGVGEVTVVVPPTAALDIKAKNGIGSVNLPKRFKGKGGDGFGINKKAISPNYADAEQQVKIRFKGGIGELNIREAEIV